MAQRVVIEACLLAAALVGPTGICSAQSAFRVGVGIHLPRATESAQTVLAAIDSRGLGVRVDAFWSNLETRKGELRWPQDLAGIDRVVDAMARSGLHPVVVLAYGNRFYDGGGLITSAQGRAAYVKYALFVVDHFKHRVDLFEVWNEWNIGAGANAAGGGKGDPVQYEKLLSAVYSAVKASNPQVQVLGGALSGGPKQAAWVAQFAAAGGLDVLDGFSIHPYVHCEGGVAGFDGQSGNARAEFSKALRMDSFGSSAAPANAASSPVGGTPEQSIASLDSLHDQLSKAKPSKSTPVYITEMGWPTSQGQCGIPPRAVAGYLQRFLLLARARSWVAGVWWYDLFDDGSDPSQRENRFGLFTLEGIAKPAFEALQSIRGLLTSSVVSQETAPTGEVVLRGRDGRGKQWYAAWMPSNDFSLRQPWTRGAQLLDSGFRNLDSASTGPEIYVSAVPVFLTEE